MTIYNYYIYKITNKLNNKCYIGKSKNPKGRWQSHIKGKNSYISRAIKKHGIENFKFEIIEVIPFFTKPNKKETKEYIDSREIYYILKFNSYAHLNDDIGGYNCTYGGEGGYNKSAMDVTMNKIENGTHNFQDKEWCKRENKRRIENGTHNFLYCQKERVKNGTHHWLGPDFQKAKANRPIVKLVKELYIKLGIKQPKCIHAKNEKWLQEKYEELITMVNLS